MAFKDEYDFSQIVNEAERLVLEELERRLGERSAEGICLCQDCVLDMATLALNSLKPLYRVSLLGTLYAQAMEEGTYAGLVRTAVEQAIDKVQSHPSHD